MEAKKLVDDLSKDGVLLMLYNVEHVQDLQMLLRAIYSTKIQLNKEINIVIVCRMFSIKHILRKVGKMYSYIENFHKDFLVWLLNCLYILNTEVSFIEFVSNFCITESWASHHKEFQKTLKKRNLFTYIY